MSRKPGKTVVVGQSEVLQPTRGKRAEHLKSQVTPSLRRRKLGDVTRVSNFLGLPSAGAFAWRHRCAPPDADLRSRVLIRPLMIMGNWAGSCQCCRRRVGIYDGADG